MLMQTSFSVLKEFWTKAIANWINGNMNTF
jgi:hypothetical protein